MIINSFRQQNRRKKRSQRLKPPSRRKKIARRGVKNKPKSQMRLDYEEYLASEEWAAKRLNCIIAAGKKCEICQEEGSLFAHHYNYLNLKNERPEDLFCLCGECHGEYHKKVSSSELPQDSDLPRSHRLSLIKKVIARRTKKTKLK